MKKEILIALPLFLLTGLLCQLQAQVGIGTTSPTNTLHVKPTNPNEDPLRVEDLNNIMQGDSALLVVDPATGVVRYMKIDEIFNNMTIDVDVDATNELQNAAEVPLAPFRDLDGDGAYEYNVQQAVELFADKLPKGTYKSISDARAAGLVNGDSFWADPRGLFGCSGCVITLHPGM